MLRSLRSVVVVFACAAAAAFFGALISAASTSGARGAEAYASPTVCQTDGICFEVDNTGHGVSIEGQALSKRGVGVRGLASSATMVGTGVSGQAFGPSSIAVNGVAFSTDPNRASQGVVGMSANGTGVEGVTTFNSTLTLTAASGVLGRDRSTAFAFDTGVEGVSTRGVGIAGISQSGNAVTGSSANANGVVGQTSFFATSGQGQAGVLGQDLATPNPFGTPNVNAGVEGTSLNGSGVVGVSGVSGSSTGNAGVIGESNGGIGVLAQSVSGNGLAATSQLASAITATSKSGEALIALSEQEGVITEASNNALSAVIEPVDGVSPPPDAIAVSAVNSYGGVGIFSQGNPGIDGDGVGGGPGVFAHGQGGAGLFAESNGPLVIIASNGSSNVMSLDGNGNMILAGSLTQNGSPMVAHRAKSGWGIGTYSAQESQATIEDVGESELTGGQTFVRMDPHFAALLASDTNYLVFLTPQGDCRGLYATQKSLSGFFVRELQGGHSSIAFDYRIVGKPADSNGDRLPVIRPVERYRLPAVPSRRHPSQVAPKLLIPRIRPNYVPSRP